MVGRCLPARFLILVGLGLLLGPATVDARSNKAKLFNATPEKVFEAAQRAAERDLHAVITQSDEKRLALEFRVDQGKGPVSENWSGVYFRVTVEPTVGDKALLGLTVVRVAPLVDSSVVRESRTSEECVESAYAEMFLDLVKVELGGKRRPRNPLAQLGKRGCGR